MIAAHEDRKALLHGFRAARRERLGPGDRFRQMMDGGVRAGHVAQGSGRHVAPILGGDTKVGEAAGKARDAERGGTHQAAVALLAAVDGCADEDRMGFHGASCDVRPR